MCGIVGWVEFDPRLKRGTTGRPMVEAMSSTLACRGPDDQGCWADARAILAHRRLAVIDPPGGRQPMTVSTPDGPVVLTYSGEVYNFAELRAELEASGHRFITRSDTEVVLRGYLAWGDEVVHRLAGMYAFGIWDARKPRLLLVRDRLGVKPLFWHRTTTGGVLFGSEIKSILAHPDVESRVELDGLRELFGYTKTPGQAIFAGIPELRPGSRLVADRDGVVEEIYWRLPTRPHRHDRDTTVRRVREVLEGVVAEQLVADVPRGLLLSGGLDSSAVAAIAAGRVDEPIRSFAVEFTGHAEHALTGLPQRERDGPFASLVADHIGSAHRELVMDSPALADPTLRRRVVWARELPIGFGDVDASLLRMFESIRTTSTVALSGEAADELFGGYTQFFDPAACAADTMPWCAHYVAEQAAERALFTTDLDRALDLDTYRADRFREAVTEVDRLDGEPDDEYRMRRAVHLHVTRHAQNLLDRKDRLSMAVGLEVRVPYCDHRLVEYVYNVPWTLKTDDGREKSLLRNAVDDMLPAAVLNRIKSGYPATPHPAYVAALTDQVTDLLSDRGHRVFDLVDHDWLSRALIEPVVSPDTLRRCLHRTLELAVWLDLYQPKIG